jgi:hypothetical protein
MTKAPTRFGSPRERESGRLLILTIFSLFPALAYFIILVLGFLFDVRGPARLLVSALSGQWSVPLLWLVVIGGPLLGMICSLNLGVVRPSGSKLQRFCGGIAGVLLVLNLVSCIPFPFILAFE